MNNLPLELIELILQYLPPQHLFPILCANWKLCAAGVKILYHHLNLIELLHQPSENVETLPWYAVTDQHDRLSQLANTLGHCISDQFSKVNDGSPTKLTHNLKRKLSALVGDQDGMMIYADGKDKQSVKNRRLSSSSLDSENDDSYAELPDTSTSCDSSLQTVNSNQQLYNYGTLVKNFEIANTHSLVSQAFLLNDSGIRLNKSDLCKLLQNLSRLRHLSLAHCLSVEDVILQTLPLSCLAFHLTHLNLSYCTQLTDDGMSKVLQCCNPLKHLNVEGNFTLSDTCLIVLSECCPFVQELNIGQCPRVTQVGLRAITKRLGENLRCLSIAGCVSITSFEAITQHCRSLHIVSVQNIRHVQDMFVVELCSTNANLMNLSIEDCNLLTDVSLQALGTLQSLSRLNCTLLHRLTDNGINSMVTNALYELYLGKCVLLTNDALLCVADNCPQLGRIYLAGCRNINDESVIVLLKKCPIIVLSVPGTMITDASIEVAIEYRSSILEVAQFSYCPYVTANAVAKLAYYCRETLTILQLVCAPQVSYVSWLRQFSQPIPHHIRNMQNREGYCAIRPPQIHNLGLIWFNSQAA